MAMALPATATLPNEEQSLTRATPAAVRDEELHDAVERDLHQTPEDFGVEAQLCDVDLHAAVAAHQVVDLERHAEAAAGGGGDGPRR